MFRYEVLPINPAPISANRLMKLVGSPNLTTSGSTSFRATWPVDFSGPVTPVAKKRNRRARPKFSATIAR